MALAFFENSLQRYRPVFAATDISCMIQLEKFLQLKQCCHCFIEMKGFPVYLMKCPASVSTSVKRWIVEEGFNCK